MDVTTENEGSTNGSDGVPGLPLSLHELLEPAIKRSSDKVAVICGETSLTFGDVDSLASRLSKALIQRGVGRGDLVGVALDRCVELVAVLLAVLKAGAAYVPIEPALPAGRIKQMIENACPKLIITGANDLDALSFPDNVSCSTLDNLLHAITPELSNGDHDKTQVQSDDLAYVMYTSGSTGQPKGVEITHGGLTNLMLSMQMEPGCSETDRWLAITTVSFDMAVADWFLPLFRGATMVIAEKHELTDMAALVRLMDRHKITIMQGTPTLWQMLLDSGWRGQPRLCKILAAGEAFPRLLADRLMDCADEVWNMYGATEASVYSSMWMVRRDQDMVVGGPIANTHLYVLDEDMSPVPLGTPGELCIGGLGVGRGYRSNAKLTAERFVKNPFHPGLMYRTGDVGRFTAPGVLSIMGRMDGQVKIRGNRVELGEIEAAITAHKDISAAVVIGRDDRLVAYCTRKPKPTQNGISEIRRAVSNRIDRVLRPWVTDRLPAYMVPAFFVEMESFPRSISGKIDRKALPDPIAELEATESKNMPASELEGRILLIWSRALGHDHVSINDNFFEVGGDSLRVVRVQKELETLLGRTVPAAKLFEHFTIKTQAAYLSGSPDGFGSHYEAKEQPLESGDYEDIAIVSMACRLPGDVATPEDFWELLANGEDAITDVPKGRWSSFASSGTPDQSCCSRGGFLSSIESYDISFFGISPREARRWDPSHYLMLEVCWEAFERAGHTMEHLRGSQTGVFIGSSNILAHQGLNPGAIRDLADLDGYTVTGSAGGTLSGRISYQLGLQGPTMTIDTACSSSLVSTHLACAALRRGECDLAVSGGVTLMLNQGLHVEFSRLGGMSPDGRCRSFSADTEGTGWAEGSAAVLLKRLSDAQRDGDRIHAVIRGSAVNHDGRSATLTAPSGPAQQRLVRTALAAARLQPPEIDYIETHGTATKLGDPIEATALADVFGPGRTHQEPLQIGAAKSNIGHTQAASGLVGLIKVVLAMQHEALPQTLHITKPTPAVDWQGANMTPVLSKRPWLAQESRLRRAGISAFGIGGTNAHMILEESPRSLPAINGVRMSARLPEHLPFLLSAESNAALQMQVENLAQHMKKSGRQDKLVDIAYSLATTRDHYRKRVVLAARDETDLFDQLAFQAHPDTFQLPVPTEARGIPKLAMLFTGQGSQWPGMGKELCEVYPVFDQAVHEITSKFDGELEIPLLDVMWAEPGSAQAALLDRTDFAQPALFTLEVALWRLWQNWGVTPEYVLGHSLGEIVAAHVAGGFNLSDACRLVAARGRLMQTLSGDHSMVSLEASAEEVAGAIEQLSLGSEIDIAAVNTPTQTVISGGAEAVEKVAHLFAGRGRKTKTLVVGHAFHSRYMDGMLAEFEAVATTLYFKPPHISIISGLDGSVVKAGQMETAQYWSSQVRKPVRFHTCIQTLARQGVNVFLELGPEQVLCGMGAACLADREGHDSVSWLPSLGHRQDSSSTLQGSLGQLHVRHIPINWHAYFKPFGCHGVELPTYAFQRQFHVREALGIEKNGTEKSINGHDTSKHTNSTTNEKSQVDQSQFKVEWQPAKQQMTHSTGTWGLLTPFKASKLATDLTTSLSKSAIDFVQVIDLEHASKLDGVLCLWDLDVHIQSQTQEVMAQALVQLQTAARIQLLPPLVWITRQVVGTGDEHDDRQMNLGPGSLLWGLMRTARSEHPELRLRLVDVSQEVATVSVAAGLMLNHEPECAIRGSRMLVPRLQRAETTPAVTLAKQPLVRNDGAVLITGGLGDLGVRVAWWLVQNHGIRDLVLTSRHGMGASGADALVEELSNMGVRASVIAADVASPEGVSSVMSAFDTDRPLRGVVHAAGVLDSGVLSTITAQRCETTIAPKAYGAWNLHEATRDMDLDMFMMFSSISGVMGMPGLANYAASNTYLDALAHFRRAQGLPGTSVAYGTWAGDGGMASRLGQATHAHLAQYGLDPLPPDDGLELLQRSVVSGRPLIMAAVLDLDRLRIYLEDQGGGIPPFLSTLLVKQDSIGSQFTSSGRQGLRELLNQAKPDEHFRIVLDMVQRVVVKALGFIHTYEVEVDRPLKDVGIDSLTAVQVRNHLATLTGLTLSTNIVFFHPNLRSLSQSLLSQLQEAQSLSPSNASNSRLNIEAICRGCLDKTFTFDIPTQNGSTQKDVQPGAAFLTGATGFVGVFVLHELLKQGITTYCLVRADCPDQAHERLMATLREYSLWEDSFATLARPIAGDISMPLLGMADEVFDDLADRVDTICHSGALVDWMRPLQDYVGPNIVSAHEVLRLASRGQPKAIHLVSTISTLPIHNGLGLREQDLEYGYGTSKYIAERLVAAARWRGAKTAVYRLPYVTASTATGHFRRDRGDFLNNLIAGGLEIGAFPAVDADMSAVLPVDYLAKTIVAIMTRDTHRLGRDYDFLSTRAPTCGAFFQKLCDLAGEKPRELVAFDAWKQRALDHAAAHPKSPIARITAVLDGYTGENAATMFKGLPVGEHVLGGDKYPAPALDDGFARAYLSRIGELRKGGV